MEPKRKNRWPYENNVILITWFIWGFVGLDRFLIANLFPWVLPDLKINFTDAGLIMAVIAITWSFSSAIFGNVSDRIGRRKIIIPATIVFSLLSWITGFARNLPMLLAIRGLMGVPEGAYMPTAVALVAEESTPTRRGVNIGLFMSAFAIVGMLFCPIYATQAAAAWGWRWALYLTLIPGVILAALFWRFIREPAGTAERIKARREAHQKIAASGGHATSEWGKVITNRNVLVCCGQAIFAMGWFYLFLTFAMLFLTRFRGFHPSDAGVILSLWGVGGAVGYVGLTWISDQIGRKLAIIIGGLGVTISGYCMAYVATGRPGLMTAICFMGFFGMGVFPLTVSVTPFEAVPSELGGSAVGLTNLIGEIFGGAILPAVGGMVADHVGLQTTMLICALCGLVMCFWGSLLRETAPKVLARRQGAVKVAVNT